MEFITMELKGIAKDANEKFPIRFEYSATGTAFFIGCRVVAKKELNNGNTIEKKYDIRAFGEIAEELASVCDGTEIHVKADYDMNKGKDDKWYPIATVTEIISIG
jgi:hypothetical protein